MTALRVWHIGVTTRDIEKSIEFYEKIGFQYIEGSEVANPMIEQGLMVPGAKKLRWAHVAMGDDGGTAMLDLVQFLEPEPFGEPLRENHNVGITRFSLLTRDIEQTRAEIEAKGITFLNPITEVLTPVGPYKMCFTHDPDGTLVQLAQPPADKSS